MQAKDIPDEAMIEAVRACNEARCNYPMDAGYHGGRPGYAFGRDDPPKPHWANRWDLARLFPEAPEKVVLAKLRSLIKRKLINGCPCGCRGDFETPEYTQRWMAEARSGGQAPPVSFESHD